MGSQGHFASGFWLHARRGPKPGRQPRSAHCALPATTCAPVHICPAGDALQVVTSEERLLIVRSARWRTAFEAKRQQLDRWRAAAAPATRSPLQRVWRALQGIPRAMVGMQARDPVQQRVCVCSRVAACRHRTATRCQQRQSAPRSAVTPGADAGHSAKGRASQSQTQSRAPPVSAAGRSGAGTTPSTAGVPPRQVAGATPPAPPERGRRPALRAGRAGCPGRERAPAPSRQ